jgi:hypothetical protein
MEEESVASDCDDSSFIDNKEDCENHVAQLIEADLLYELIFAHAEKVMRVRSFLVMCIIRFKYQKLKKSTIKI